MGTQLALKLPERNWGGRRAGAGRPRKHALPELHDKAGLPHVARPQVKRHHPVHVSLRVRSGVGNLRGHTRVRIIQAAFHDARGRFGMRIVHWSVQSNHLHLIVEAESREALARGMQAVASRVARNLNALVSRRGAVFVDRYYAHILESRREVAHAVRYVLCNLYFHIGEREARPSVWPHVDPCSSAWYDGAPDELRPQAAPRTWFLVDWDRTCSAAVGSARTN